MTNFNVDKPSLSELPPSFKPKKKVKFYKPSIKDLIEKTKSLPFWKEEYYLADLNRVCEMEELISEWYDIDLRSTQKRMETLETFGFKDLLNKDDDFQYIINQFNQGE